VLKYADVAHYDGFARLNSNDLSRIDAHIRATDDDRLYIGQCAWKRGHQHTRSGCWAAKSLLRSNIESKVLILILTSSATKAAKSSGPILAIATLFSMIGVLYPHSSCSI